MAICSSCGTILPDSRAFCPQCGARIFSNDDSGPDGYSDYDAPDDGYYDERGGYYEPEPYREPEYDSSAYDYDRDKDGGKTLGVGAFFGSLLLMLIPVVGFVVQIIWAIGSKNANRRNLARAFLILSVIGFALLIAAYLLIAPYIDLLLGMF